MNVSQRILLLGGAGLVGQNLLVLFAERGYRNVTVIDKHAANAAIARRLHPWAEVVVADLAEPGEWEQRVEDADAVVMLQAQIGGENEEQFLRNSVASTQLALAACSRGRRPYIVHVSSSVVNSVVKDWYTESKRAQEQLVAESGLPHCILRPTLMFGWFDRKHLGWLVRFMRRSPVFPIPGNGRFTRQPLFERDFCEIVLSCLVRRETGGPYNITGRERIAYIDLIRAVKRASGARTLIVRIPYGMFWWLLRAYALFDGDPPFTTKQLEALVAPDDFELIPWWNMFGVTSTPLDAAVTQAFGPGPYRDVVLEF
jgi:nucleoside-diphosphate-sugar epimerase